MRFHCKLGVTVAPHRCGCHANAPKARVAACPHTQDTADPRPATRRAGSTGAASKAAQRIDELLFTPHWWWMLDKGNERVAQVKVTSLAQAFEMVGRGSCATFFGRLRPGVVVVDVDMARGQAVSAELVGWCIERGLWHLVRDSGQAGHRHVFIVAADAQDDLEAFVRDVRAAYGVARATIEVRRDVRPLSAPHRSGATPPLPQRIRQAARRLPPVIRALPEPAAAAAPTTPRRPVPLTAPAPAIGPGKRRDLPRAWATYLRDGVRPPWVAQWPDQTRSAVESTATWAMVRAGWTADEAWVAISTAHPSAMTRSRGASRGRSWWTRYVWNPKVTALAGQEQYEGAPAARRASESTEVASEVTERVEAARAAFLAAWGRYGRDRRETLRFVLEALLDRMARGQSLTVPCPQRDLLLDTALSRPVIASALEQLHDDGWVVLHRSFDPTSDAPEGRSHHVSLPAAPTGGTPMRLPLPPSTSPPRSPSHPPLPMGRDLRTHLGPRLFHTWRALPHGAQNPAPVGDLGFPTGLVPTLDSSPSPSQLRTLRARLHDLAVMGLALCDERGRWKALPAEMATSQTIAAAELAHRERTREVSAERAAYAEVRAGRGRWVAERNAVLARARTTRYLAAQRWWTSLSEHERQERRREYQGRFAALAPFEQQQRKDQLAQQRAEAGVVSEDAVRQAWIRSCEPEAYETRVIERTQRFHNLPWPLRVAQAQAWAEHRARWGITRDPTPLPSATAAVADELRDAGDGMHHQLELVIFDDPLSRGGRARLAQAASDRRHDELEVPA